MDIGLFSSPLHEDYNAMRVTNEKLPEDTPGTKQIPLVVPKHINNKTKSEMDIGLFSSPLHEDYHARRVTKEGSVTAPTADIPGRTKRILLVVQAFPPLLKNAGGVAKRYLTLCRAMIDGLGWTVTIMVGSLRFFFLFILSFFFFCIIIQLNYTCLFSRIDLFYSYSLSLVNDL